MPADRPAAEIRPDRPRTGFTLVELMVVIGIIAILAALITPAVIGARTSARNAAIKAEIDMLHMAIMNYKNEYGSFPPCVNPAAAQKHLQRLFPRMQQNTAGEQIDALRNLNNGQVVAAQLSPATALCQWLSGYADDPIAPVTGGLRKKMFDFDQSRITNGNEPPPKPLIGQYYPSGKKLGSPYIYIDAASYTTAGGSGSASVPVWPFSGATTGAPGFTGYFAHRVPMAGAWNTVTQPAFNEDSFQILCAGLDEVFGTDDDLSNFWPGTRKQYLDSLK